MEHGIPMEGDGNLLARLFENLLNNAVKYGKDGKIIRFANEESADCLFLGSLRLCEK